MKALNCLLCAAALSFPGTALSADSHFSIQDLVYVGATRMPVENYGESRLGFANGTFMVDSDRNSFFVIGHTHHMAIAEFQLNGFSDSENVTDLPMAQNVQPFVNLFDRVPSVNVDKLNHITGMKKIDGSLFINAAQYYDGNADNTDTSFILEDPSDLSGSSVKGFFKLDAGVKSAGWITEIPSPKKDVFKADYIFGFASNLPINGRSSMGPSAYAVRAEELAGLEAGDVIQTNKLLSFSIANQLHPDHYNESRENDIWTEVSNAFTGFIVPGTNTYAVFGSSGGHQYGIGYKITQDDGTACGGGCPYVASDAYNYYWLWDIEDLIKVQNGELDAFQVRPFEYGEIKLPLQDQDRFDKPRGILSAYYDFENQDLYFMLNKADAIQSRYEYAPILLKYSIRPGLRPSAPEGISVN